MPDTSTLAPFAGVDALINQSVGQLLSNAVAVYESGAPFGVLFDRAAADPFSGAVDSSTMTVAYDIAKTPGVQEGSEMLINDLPHIVRGPVQPDASGWVVLSVYPKA